MSPFLPLKSRWSCGSSCPRPRASGLLAGRPRAGLRLAFRSEAPARSSFKEDVWVLHTHCRAAWVTLEGSGRSPLLLARGPGRRPGSPVSLQAAPLRGGLRLSTLGLCSEVWPPSQLASSTPGLQQKSRLFHLYFPGERDLHPSFPVSVDHPVYSPFRKAHKCAPFWKDLLHPGKGGRSLAASLPAPRPGLLCLCPASDGSPGLLPGFCTPLKSCVHMLPEQTARLLVGPGRDEALFASS